MKIEVELGDQPLEFIRRQPAETRRALREILHEVERGKACFEQPTFFKDSSPNGHNSAAPAVNSFR